MASSPSNNETPSMTTEPSSVLSATEVSQSVGNERVIQRFIEEIQYGRHPIYTKTVLQKLLTEFGWKGTGK